ncbi:hypothetical protein F8M41_000676 [Gigaspora margarita]|uniref:Uncharacterized protein n=1 Tax=Gigaspora margarita TaxID=4874 RepID=A0A8H4AAR6_GIGMA|nr:hypothetical protein F8M41_000676 [Gigaspora margarita]
MHHCNFLILFSKTWFQELNIDLKTQLYIQTLNVLGDNYIEELFLFEADQPARFLTKYLETRKILEINDLYTIQTNFPCNVFMKNMFDYISDFVEKFDHPPIISETKNIISSANIQVRSDFVQSDLANSQSSANITRPYPHIKWANGENNALTQGMEEFGTRWNKIKKNIDVLVALWKDVKQLI